MRGTDAKTGKPLDGMAHLKQSIRDILTTPLGSRVMRRDYGSRLFDLVDAPLTPNTIADIYAATVEALSIWEPRIYPQRVKVSSVTGDAVAPPVPHATGNMVVRDWNAYQRTYARDGVENGRPKYTNAEGSLKWVVVPGFLPGSVLDQYWELNIPGEDPGGSPSTLLVVRSRSDVPTPDLASDWYLASNDQHAAGFSVRPEIVTPSAASPSQAHAIIELTAIYIPDGRVLTIDGINVS